MDTRRLSTADVLGSGILSMQLPKTDIPRLPQFDPDDQGDLRKALTEGKLITCPEYYGIPYLWRDEHGYHGRLLQYRRVSESCDWSHDETDAAIEWFEETLSACRG